MDKIELPHFPGIKFSENEVIVVRLDDDLEVREYVVNGHAMHNQLEQLFGRDCLKILDWNDNYHMTFEQIIERLENEEITS